MGAVQGFLGLRCASAAPPPVAPSLLSPSLCLHPFAPEAQSASPAGCNAVAGVPSEARSAPAKGGRAESGGKAGEKERQESREERQGGEKERRWMREGEEVDAE